MLPCVIGQSDRASARASSTVCLTNRLFSQNTLFLNPSSQEGITASDHVAFSMDRLSRRIKTLISNVRAYGVSCRNTNALIHSHMYPRSNPVLAQLGFVHFSQVLASGEPLMKA